MTLVGSREHAPNVDDPAAVGAPAAAAAVLAPAPGRDEAHTHGAQRGAVLVAAVPSGYTGLLQHLSNDGPAATLRIGDGPQFVSTVYLIVTTGQADGLLTVSIYGGVTGLGDDICSPAVNDYLDRLYETYPTTCDVVTVNGVQMRVSSAYDEARGTINRATRLLDGGVLTVEAQQGIPVQHRRRQPPTGRRDGRPDRRRALDPRRLARASRGALHHRAAGRHRGR